MRIYYFGELIQDTNADETNSAVPKTREEVMQTQFVFNDEPKQPKKEGMPSVGELLEGLDLSLDVYRPFRKAAQ